VLLSPCFFFLFCGTDVLESCNTWINNHVTLHNPTVRRERKQHISKSVDFLNMGQICWIWSNRLACVFVLSTERSSIHTKNELLIRRIRQQHKQVCYFHFHFPWSWVLPCASYEKHKSRQRTQLGDITTNFAAILRQILFFFCYFSFTLFSASFEGGRLSVTSSSFLTWQFSLGGYEHLWGRFLFFYFKVDCFLLFR